MARKIVIAANKGGVLKTSISVNLAGILKDQGKVLIIDMDAQGNVLTSFGKNPDDYEETLYDVMVDGLSPDRTIINVYDNIDVLPSNSDMSYAEFDIYTNISRYDNVMYLLQHSMKHIEHNYDFIVLDTPPTLGLIHQNAFAFVDEILIPFHPEPYSMRSFVSMLTSVKEFQQKTKPSLEILGIVPTLIDRRVKIHSDILEKAREFANENNFYVFNTEIPATIEYTNAIAKDQLPLTLVKSRLLSYSKKRKVYNKKRKSLNQPYYDLWEEMNYGKKQTEST